MSFRLTGCAITELFLEGKPPFVLSQLLAYIRGDYSPEKLVHKIDDVCVRDLVSTKMLLPSPFCKAARLFTFVLVVNIRLSG